MSSAVPKVSLGNGLDIPALGYGTYLVRDFRFVVGLTFNHFYTTLKQAKEGQGIDLVKKAIDAGYRHIDTAFLYENEVEVGQAIRDKIAEGVVKREELFVTSKVVVIKCRRIFLKIKVMILAMEHLPPPGTRGRGLPALVRYARHWLYRSVPDAFANGVAISRLRIRGHAAKGCRGKFAV